MCEKMDPNIKAQRERLSNPYTDKHGNRIRPKKPVVIAQKCSGCRGICGSACSCLNACEGKTR